MPAKGFWALSRENIDTMKLARRGVSLHRDGFTGWDRESGSVTVPVTLQEQKAAE